MRCLFSLALIYFGLITLPAEAQMHDSQYRIYFTIESGWQSVEYKKIRSVNANLLSGRLGLLRPAGVFDIAGPKKDDAFIATGGLGAEWRSPLFEFLFFSSLLHIGGEVSAGYSSFRGEVDNVFDTLSSTLTPQPTGRVMTDTVRVAESFAFNLATDFGFYLFQNLLLFGRFGYAYIESERDVLSIEREDVLTLQGPHVSEEARYADMGTVGSHAFIAGIGLRYQLIENLGARFYYLNHIGRREAHDIRFGLIWWIF